MEYQLREQGAHRNWSTIKKQLSTHQRITVIVTDEEDQIHHIRISGITENSHKEVYELLKITDPLKREAELSEKGCSDQIKNRNPGMTGFLGILIDSRASIHVKFLITISPLYIL
ncbi:uncharacterized protein YukJ [Virgibacillus halotolerans]|nr:uncharacterized protein YukJ [Virgibacillus halotolerans]